MHHIEVFRRWRIYPHPASDKRACRPSGGICEVELRASLLSLFLTSLHSMMHAVASYLCRGIEAVITGLTRKKLALVTISALKSLVNSHFFGKVVLYYLRLSRVRHILRRCIEVVITVSTRNFVVTLEPPTLNPLIYKGFPQFK